MSEVTPAFSAMCAEPWAITADWLHVIASIALRKRDDAQAMAAQIRAGDGDRGGPPPLTPDQRFATLMYVSNKQKIRPLDNQGSGRAVVVGNVAVLPILGPIFPRANMMTSMSGATSIVSAQRDLQAALDDDAVQAIVFSVDSPGGAVGGVNAFADMVFASRKMKPTCAHVSGLGCSAAYWIASAAERVSLDKTALVGSIGVAMAVPKQVQADRDGEMTIDIVSTNAPDKRPDPSTDAGMLTLRASLDAIEATFLADVARGRGTTSATVVDKFGKGGVVVGKEAVSRGMADGVETLDAAIGRMARVGRSRTGSRPSN